MIFLNTQWGMTIFLTTWETFPQNIKYTTWFPLYFLCAHRFAKILATTKTLFSFKLHLSDNTDDQQKNCFIVSKAFFRCVEVSWNNGLWSGDIQNASSDYLTVYLFKYFSYMFMQQTVTYFCDSDCSATKICLI